MKQLTRFLPENEEHQGLLIGGGIGIICVGIDWMVSWPWHRFDPNNVVNILLYITACIGIGVLFFIFVREIET